MRAICAIVASLVLAGTTFGDTINVPGDYPFIEWAIDASSDGDVIQIAAGRFDQEYSISVNKAITIQGTLNSNGSLATTVASSVSLSSSGADDAVIKNLIITKEGVSWSGSGVYISSCSPTIMNCLITGNNVTSNSGGGGIYCNNSEPTIIDCTIVNNSSVARGGGVSLFSSDAVITNCTIANNESEDTGGGGIACYNNSNPQIVSCIITGNTTGPSFALNSFGGGIYCYENSNPTITDCTISNNSALTGESNTQGSGGGIACREDSSPTITSCTITNNIAQDFGGGLFILDTSNPEIEDTTVCGNTPSQILGSWIDNGSNSVTEVCSGGACCLEEECTVTAESDCTATGGNYLGDGTGCSLDPCNVPPGPGACCTNNNCIVVQEADCLLFFGQWLGDGTSCDDASCPTDCEGDTNGDGAIDVNDILLVIARYGFTCP